jgi:Ca2+/Na+ antiporter
MKELKRFLKDGWFLLFCIVLNAVVSLYDGLQLSDLFCLFAIIICVLALIFQYNERREQERLDKKIEEIDQMFKDYFNNFNK